MQKLIVIGGGAAGFFCAINAARLRPDLKVVLLEKSGKLLSKVKVSGGGRCNTTHACFEIPTLVKKYPRGETFLKKAFHQFNTNHTIQWFLERGVGLHEESDGRMFPTNNQSQTIIDCLLKEADKYKVEIVLYSEVKSIEPTLGGFKLMIGSTSNSMPATSIINTQFICIACGGYPKSDMFNWLRKLNHTIQSPVPSLFTFNIPKHPITSLMGLSVPNVSVKIVGTKLKEAGPLLITHWGLSGPVILRLSAWGARQLSELQYNFSILVNWLGDTNEAQLREEWGFYREQFAAQKMGGKNPFSLPARLWNFILESSGIAEHIRWAELKSLQQNKLIQLLTVFPFDVSGKTTFKEEFVTCGGITLSEINAQSMESKIIPDLFFAGEIMDIDGITGGFNFQHAWTSGWIAASAIAKKQSN